ncbi:metal ABC transporter permease [Thioalkalivibrio thiocyanodenitrificans]|uniref:metal ABC transporter permease n=1 Tax=Thioalkalivibrio thiocyanodenitrificans TaxID=243063 RepID=UPI000370DFAD|nr:metal ABC transporter permease [Thioalkalivibrio thiocyanodenitrificans]
MFELLLDPLFHLPFVTGLVLAPLAAVAGVYLRLRNEWLAALAYAQVAAAGGVLAVVIHAPVMAGALVAAGLVAIAKGLLERAGNDHFAVFILIGWGVALVAAAFTAHGDMVSKSLMDGQLYFTGQGHLVSALLLLVVGAAIFPWLSKRLLMSCFFPDHFSANGIPAWRHHVLFDLLVVAAVALATTSFGVMAAFALVFVPPWIAWALSRGWRWVLLLAAAIATVAYVIAFVLAIALDQPFGPMLVLTCGVLSLLRLAGRLRRPVQPSVDRSVGA